MEHEVNTACQAMVFDVEKNWNGMVIKMFSEMREK
jgi:hypothetical protein